MTAITSVTAVTASTSVTAVTASTLTRKVCELSDALSVSASILDDYRVVDQYLSKGKLVGSVMCLIALISWYMTLGKEINSGACLIHVYTLRVLCLLLIIYSQLGVQRRKWICLALDSRSSVMEALRIRYATDMVPRVDLALWRRYGSVTLRTWYLALI